MRQTRGDADQGRAGMSCMCTADEREESFERNGMAHLTTKYPWTKRMNHVLCIVTRKCRDRL